MPNVQTRRQLLTTLSMAGAAVTLARWGLVPYWAKDIKVGFANINAKADGIEGKPAFREAFQRRRCLVPVAEDRDGQAALCGRARRRVQGPGWHDFANVVS